MTGKVQAVPVAAFVTVVLVCVVAAGAAIVVIIAVAIVAIVGSVFESIVISCQHI